MKNQVLWYNTEAKTWVEALPIGNGQMAALMFGNPTKERIALNIANLWSGDGRDKANVNQNIDWDAIREPIKKGQYQEAEELIKEKVLGDWTECFLPAGSIVKNIEIQRCAMRRKPFVIITLKYFWSSIKENILTEIFL